MGVGGVVVGVGGDDVGGVVIVANFSIKGLEVVVVVMVVTTVVMLLLVIIVGVICIRV